LVHPAVAPATAAGVGDHFPRSAALRAGRLLDENAGLPGDHAATAAARAHAGAAAAFRAAGIAGPAGPEVLDLKLFLRAARRFLEADLQIVAQVAAALLAAAALAASAAEKLLEAAAEGPAENLREQVHRIVEPA